jgi:hypothetical protein
MSGSKMVKFSQKSAEITTQALIARSTELLKLAKKASILGQEEAVKSIKGEALEVNMIVVVLTKEFDIDAPAEKDDDNDE